MLQGLEVKETLGYQDFTGIAQEISKGYIQLRHKEKVMYIKQKLPAYIKACTIFHRESLQISVRRG